MNTILFEDLGRNALLPFVFTRPVYELRVGIYTLRERWEQVLGQAVLGMPHTGLAGCFGVHLPSQSATWVNGRYSPDENLLHLLRDMAPGSYAWQGEDVLVACFSPEQLLPSHAGLITKKNLDEIGLKSLEVNSQAPVFNSLTSLFELADLLIRYDFELAAGSVKRGKIHDPHTRIYGGDNVFVAEGASCKAAILNAEDGPIYLGPHAQVKEGAIIHGTHAIGTHSQVKMGAKLQGGSSFGPYVKAGGEISQSVIMGYSNKGHDGYLGNSVLGYWCNLGADSNTSNLKNNYAEVKLWDYRSERFEPTGSLFCGLMMGDHSKCGINTMFNTGTVVGVAANIFGPGYPRNFIPSFSWGGSSGFKSYRLDKAMETAECVMARRKQQLSTEERDLLADIFEQTRKYRHWEKQ